MLSTRSLGQTAARRAPQAAVHGALFSAVAAHCARRLLSTTGVRLNDSNSNSSGNEAQKTASSKYDKQADLDREQAARERFIQQGMPNFFKVAQQAQQAGSPGAGGFPSGSSGSQAASSQGGSTQRDMSSASGAIGSAWEEAYKQASQKFFGTDKPPENIANWGTAWRAHTSGQPQQQQSGSGDASSSSSSGSSTSSAGAGSTPFGANPFGGAGGMPPGGAMPGFQGGATISVPRLLAGLIIVYCSFWIMRRLGVTGNFEHINVPYWAVAEDDAAQWLLFLFNIEDSRRTELARQYEAAKGANPHLRFFDFVDQAQPDWASTPTFSKQEVISAIATYARQNGHGMTTMGTIRAGLDGGSSMFASLAGMGFNNAGLSHYQKRIEGLMRVLAQQSGNPFAAKPIMMARTVPAPGTSGEPSQWTPMWQQGMSGVMPMNPQHFGGPGGLPQPLPPHMQQSPQERFGSQSGTAPQWPPAQAGFGQQFQPPPPQFGNGGYGGPQFGYPQQQQQQQQQWGYQQQGHGTMPFVPANQQTTGQQPNGGNESSPPADNNTFDGSSNNGGADAPKSEA